MNVQCIRFGQDIIATPPAPAPTTPGNLVQAPVRPSRHQALIPPQRSHLSTVISAFEEEVSVIFQSELLARLQSFGRLMIELVDSRFLCARLATTQQPYGEAARRFGLAEQVAQQIGLAGRGPPACPDRSARSAVCATLDAAVFATSSQLDSRWRWRKHSRPCDHYL